MDDQERRIQAGMKVIDDWVRADPRGYIKADDREVVSRILDAADEAVAAVNADDMLESMRLALSAHGANATTIESIIATVTDAVDNNT